MQFNVDLSKLLLDDARCIPSMETVDNSSTSKFHYTPVSNRQLNVKFSSNFTAQ